MVVVAGKGIGVIQFLWRRAARIYPPYWVVSLVVLAISLVEPAWVNSSIHDPISLWRSFLLVPATTLPLLAVGWTLIHEVYFYLVFAILLALRVPILIGLLGWGSVLLVLAILGGDYLTSFPLGRVWTNPLTAEFMLGAAIGVRYDRKGGSARVMGLATLVAAIVFVAPILQLAENRYLDAWRVVLFGIPAALIIYGLAASEQKAVQKPARLLVALGDWSYAIYLIGFVCDRSYRPCAGPPPGPIAGLVLIAVGLSVVNLVGAFTFQFFERPTLAVLHRLGSVAQVRSKHIGQKRVLTEISNCNSSISHWRQSY
jgi:exopolysaccharide production protein ExoZ